MAPNPTITSVTWPSSPKEKGQKCKTDISYRNDGDDGEVFSRVVDSVGTVLDSFTSSVAAGEISTDSVRFDMPAKDITIYAQVGVDSTVTSEKGPKTIKHEEPGALAEGSIKDYDAPSSAKLGDTVTVDTETKNMGTGSGNFRLRIQDRDTNKDVTASSWYSLTADHAAIKILSGTMPGKDWNLKSILERELPTGEVTIDDTVSYTVVLEGVPPPPPPGECPFRLPFLCRLWERWMSRQ